MQRCRSPDCVRVLTAGVSVSDGRHHDITLPMLLSPNVLGAGMDYQVLRALCTHFWKQYADSVYRHFDLSRLPLLPASLLLIWIRG